MAGSANRPRNSVEEEKIAFLSFDVNDEPRLDGLDGGPVASACLDILKPIAAVRALAETLRSGAIRDEKVSEQFLTMIIAEADRMLVIAQAILPLCSPGSKVETSAGGEDARVDNSNSIR